MGQAMSYSAWPMARGPGRRMLELLMGLIRVLLLGEHWDRLEPAFASLSNRGVAEFVGPVVKEIPEAVSKTSPTAIMVSPGYDSVCVLLLNSSAGEQAFLPPVLLCVDHESKHPPPLPT